MDLELRDLLLCDLCSLCFRSARQSCGSSTFAFVTAVLSVVAASGVKLPYLLTFASNPLIFEFLFGVLVSRYVLLFQIKNWPALLIVGIAGFAIIGLLLMVNNVILAGPILNFLRVATFGMLSAVVVAATVLMERDVRPLRLPGSWRQRIIFSVSYPSFDDHSHLLRLAHRRRVRANKLWARLSVSHRRVWIYRAEHRVLRPRRGSIA